MNTIKTKLMITNFEKWRQFAGYYLSHQVPPDQARWEEHQQRQPFDTEFMVREQSPSYRVPCEFMASAKTASCYRDSQRWALLYRILWRLTHGEPKLLRASTDIDVHRLEIMKKAVKRDSQKMKANVQFRKNENDDIYIAWYQPTHLIVERTAYFFLRHLSSTNWAIFTPDRSAYWNGVQLALGKGLRLPATPKNNELEMLWKVFYRHIFNPTQIKIVTMKPETPIH